MVGQFWGTEPPQQGGGQSRVGALLDRLLESKLAKLYQQYPKIFNVTLVVFLACVALKYLGGGAEGLDKLNDFACKHSATWQQVSPFRCVVKEPPTPPVPLPDQKIDPLEQLRQAVRAAGYSLDDESFIAAVSHAAADSLSILRQLGIQGSEVALKRALTEQTNAVGSAEFENLGTFMRTARAGHYAARIRSDIVEQIAEAKRKLSLDSLRSAACGAATGTFAVEFARSNLAKHCANASTFRDEAFFYGRRIARVLDPDSVSWWDSNREALVRVAARPPVKAAPPISNDVPTTGKTGPKERPVESVAHDPPRVPVPVVYRRDESRCIAVGELPMKRPLRIEKGRQVCSPYGTDFTEVVDINATRIVFYVNGTKRLECTMLASCAFDWKASPMVFVAHPLRDATAELHNQ